MSSARPEYPLPMKKALKAISDFNSEFSYLAMDWLVAKNFSDLEHALDPDMIPANVFLLDRLWSTNLSRYGKEDDCIKVTNAITRNREMLLEELQSLEKDDLRNKPEKVAKAADKVLPVILKAGKRQHYSFASKFFHWCTREHFPIMDSMARQAINEFERKCNRKKCRVLTSPYEDRCEDYRRWIDFYSVFLNSISDAEAAELLRADSVSAHPALLLPNSLLRVLDKCFYIEGSEE